MFDTTNINAHQSNATNINDPEETAQSESQTEGIYINIIVGIATIVVCLLVFEFFRRRFPSIYDTRRTLNARREPRDYYDNPVYAPPPPSSSFLGWISSALKLDLESIEQTHGPDAALFLRFHRTMMLLFFILLPVAAVLIGIYYSGTNKDLDETNPQHTVGVQRLSLSNVSRGDPFRFWITLLFDYVIVIATLVIIKREFSVYVRYRVRYRASRNPANYTILIQDVPTDARGSTAVFQHWDRVFPQQIARAYYIYDASVIVTKITKFWKAVTARERAEWEYANNPKLKGERPTFKPGALSCFKPKSAQVDSINYWAERQQHYKNKITLYQQDKHHEHTQPTNTALVVFKSRRAAAAAAQTSFAEREGEWTVSWAPEPNAVNWSALGIPGYQTLARSSLTIFAALALTLLWIIPVSAIMGLTNLTELSNLKINGARPFQFLAGLKKASPVLVGLLESFLPAIILSVFLGLVPTILRIFVSFSRVPSLALMDRNVRDWYFNFVVFSNFLFVLASGSLLSRLPQIIQKPGNLASFLASSAPRQGAFMTNFVLLKALSETPKEILQIGRLAVRCIMLRFVARTKRQRDTADIGNTEFLYFRYYAMSQLIGLIGLIYSTISPYIIPACFLYFVVSYIVWKYNLCYSLWNVYSSGGDFYGGALYGVWTGLFLHLVTMVGIFGLNKNPAQSALIVIPAAVMLAFLIHIRQTYTRLAEDGSSLAILKQVEVSGDMSGDEIPSEVAEKYIHPGLVALPDPVENLNGVDHPVGGMQEARFGGDVVSMEEGSMDAHDAGVMKSGDNDKRSDDDVDDLKAGDVWVDAFSGQEKLTKNSSTWHTV